MPCDNEVIKRPWCQGIGWWRESKKLRLLEKKKSVCVSSSSLPSIAVRSLLYHRERKQQLTVAYTRNDVGTSLIIWAHENFFERDDNSHFLTLPYHMTKTGFTCILCIGCGGSFFLTKSTFWPKKHCYTVSWLDVSVLREDIILCSFHRFHLLHLSPMSHTSSSVLCYSSSVFEDFNLNFKNPDIISSKEIFSEKQLREYTVSMCLVHHLPLIQPYPT